MTKKESLELLELDKKISLVDTNIDVYRKRLKLKRKEAQLKEIKEELDNYDKDMYDGWKPDEFYGTLLDARKCKKISDKYNNIAEYSQILYISDKDKNIVEDRSYSQILYSISLAIRVAAENGRDGVIYIFPYNLDNEVDKQIVRDLQCYHYTAYFY